MSADFAENLRRFRKSRTLTQQALAEQLKISVTTVSRWESGRLEPRRYLREALYRMGL